MKISTRLLLIILAVLSVQLFFGFSSPNYNRLAKEAWNLGHLFYFGLLTFLLLKIPRLKKQSFYFQVSVLSISCLALSFIIEFTQTFVSRDFSLEDVVKNLSGMYTMLFIYHAMYATKQKQKYFIIAAILSLLTGLFTFIKLSIDETLIQMNKPIIANFETPFELSRWHSNHADISISSSNSNQFLNIKLLPGKYPGVTLTNLPADWRSYKLLELSVVNTSTTLKQVTLKIHDRKHRELGYRYTDRFNRKIELAPGLNKLRISVDEIRHSPRNRLMQMDEIDSLSLFAIELKKPFTIQLDDIRLSK